MRISRRSLLLTITTLCLILSGLLLFAQQRAAGGVAWPLAPDVVRASFATAAPDLAPVVNVATEPPPKDAAITASVRGATPPMNFADPDGQELILEEVSARAAIHGMLALTEIEFRFRNPQARVIEGRFTFTLPPGAAISRFAYEISGHLMEGEVVERLRANQVYEQFLHQMRDPALLEQEQGNRFSARIFPIEANAPVRLLLSYTSLLPMRDGVRRYSLPLRGLQKVNKLTFRGFVTPLASVEARGAISTSTAEVTTLERQDWVPDRDIELVWRDDAQVPRAQILRAGDFYLASFLPGPAATRQGPAPSRWRYYIDTSASSAEGAAHRIRALEQVLRALPAGDNVELVAFDQELVPLVSGSAATVAASAGDLLRRRLFLGGTDLGLVIRDISDRLRTDIGRTVVVASDLVATVGETAPHELRRAAVAIPAEARIHALILGSREESATARMLTARRGRIVRLPFTEALDATAAAAANELRRPLGDSFDISDPGAEWFHPATVDDIGAGDEILVLGKLRAAQTPRPSAGSIAATAEVRLDSSSFGPLLERESYRAYLEYLALRESTEPSDAVRQALAAEQIRVSVEQRVVIPRTTMLVLETEWDYQRFGIDRRALAAILTIEAGGIGRVDRAPARQVDVRRPMPPRPQPLPRPMRGSPATPFASDAERLSSAGDPAGSERQMTEQVAPALTVTGRSAGAFVQSAPADAAILVQPLEPEPPMKRRVAPPPPPRPEAVAKRRRDWTKVALPPRAAIAELGAKLERDPKNRDLYNELSEVMVAHRDWNALRSLAIRWQPYDPENPQVYEVLGIAAEGLGRGNEAARAYGSLIEIAPGKPELLQRAGLLLLRSGRGSIAEAPLRRALELRPDRANAYRHLALMLWQSGRVEEAARVLETATRQTFPNWYGDVQRVIGEELGYVYRAWMKREPSRRDEIAVRAREHGVDLERRDALRITLAWETDANDVDLHVVDPEGEECFYGNRATSSGLTLYEDITRGLGPEVIRTPAIRQGTYHVGVRYFDAGPMGISRGIVIVLRGDDRIEIHPFRLTRGGEAIRYVASVR
jgi:tetratricopeptide (TPR) repeat protein